MAPGGKTRGAIERKKYNPKRLKEDLKRHLKLEMSYNHTMKRIEIELLWKDDPGVPDYLEKPEVIARDGLFVDNFMKENF
jgi:hypothetical protein